MPPTDRMREAWEAEMRAFLHQPGGQIALAGRDGWPIPGTEQPWVGDVDYTWESDRMLEVWAVVRIAPDGQKMRVPLGVAPRVLHSGHRLQLVPPITVEVT